MKWFNDLLSTPFKNSGDIIHFSVDKYGKLLVIDDGEHRTLNFDSPFEQSCMRLNEPFKLVHHYTQLMMLVLMYIKPSHITIFGLGGGSLLRALYYVLPQCCFKIIELRQKVVDIAYEYFDIPKDARRMQIIVNDVLKEMTSCARSSTDIIFSDMYDAYHMVPEQVQKRFLKNCSRLLTNNGWLVINLHSLPSNQSEFYELLSEVFPTVIMSANTGNTILFVSNGYPDCIGTNFQIIEAAEVLLQQKFMQLIPRLKPINFAYK